MSGRSLSGRSLSGRSRSRSAGRSRSPEFRATSDKPVSLPDYVLDGLNICRAPSAGDQNEYVYAVGLGYTVDGAQVNGGLMIFSIEALREVLISGTSTFSEEENMNLRSFLHEKEIFSLLPEKDTHEYILSFDASFSGGTWMRAKV